MHAVNQKHFTYMDEVFDPLCRLLRPVKQFPVFTLRYHVYRYFAGHTVIRSPL